MISHEQKIRVRYGETDKMGFVYHAHYVHYYDVARTEFIRALGTSNHELEKAGYMLPVTDLSIHYKSPAHYDDLLTVKVTLEEMPAVRLKFLYEVYRENGELINTGATTLAFMNAATKKACRGPQWFMDILKPYFG